MTWYYSSSGVLCDENLALYRSAWASYNSPYDPASNAVDNNPASAAYTGNTARPFVAVDLGGSMTIGRVSIVFGWSKYKY